MNLLTKSATFVLAVIILAGCSKDDPKPSIVGEWFIADEEKVLEVGDQPLREYLVQTGMTETEAKSLSDVAARNITIDDIGLIYRFTDDGYYGTMVTPDDKFYAIGKWTLSDDGKNLSVTSMTGSGTNTITKFTSAEFQTHRSLGSRRLNGYTFTVSYSLLTSFKRL